MSFNGIQLRYHSVCKGAFVVVSQFSLGTEDHFNLFLK